MVTLPDEPRGLVDAASPTALLGRGTSWTGTTDTLTATALISPSFTDNPRGLTDTGSVITQNATGSNERGLVDDLLLTLVGPGSIFDERRLTDTGTSKSLIGFGGNERGLTDDATATLLGTHTIISIFDDLLSRTDQGQSNGWFESFDNERGLRDPLQADSPNPGGLAVWTGSAWLPLSAKVWTGSGWSVKTVRRWSGSAWV